MNSLSDRNQALRVINGVEGGTLDAADAYNVLKDRDPVLVYFCIRYLKEKYGIVIHRARPYNSDWLS